jgi:hypothetical protein
VPATTPENAWKTLQAIGWTARGEAALCRKCSTAKKPAPGLAKALGEAVQHVKRTKRAAK